MKTKTKERLEKMAKLNEVDVIIEKFKRFYDMEKTNKTVGSKYHRTIVDINGDTMPGKVDVYSVCDAWDLVNPALQHALKKILCAGIRNKGDFKQDINEAIESLQQSFRFHKKDRG